MKITVLPTGNAPDYYSFRGETVTAYKDGQSESFDLSALSAQDKFTGIEVETLDLNGQHIMRNVYRDEFGELHLQVCQKVGPGHWEESSEIDISEYSKNKVHVVYNSDKPHAGNAWAVTAGGKQWVE